MSFVYQTQINRDNLNDEWATFPSDFSSIGADMALATTERDMVKDDLELAKAEVYIKIKTDPASFGITDSKSPTESYIASLICVSDKVKMLTENLHVKQKKYLMLRAEITAFEYKLKALDNITKLYILESEISNSRNDDSKIVPIRRKQK